MTEPVLCSECGEPLSEKDMLVAESFGFSPSAHFYHDLEAVAQSFEIEAKEKEAESRDLPGSHVGKGEELRDEARLLTTHAARIREDQHVIDAAIAMHRNGNGEPLRRVRKLLEDHIEKLRADKPQLKWPDWRDSIRKRP